MVRDFPAMGRWGSYSHRTRTITIRPDLSPVQYRWVLAHEVAHAHYGHDGYLPRWERDADRLAALWLIRLCDWAVAVRVHDSLEAIAEDLEVHPGVCRIYHLHLEGNP